MAGELNVIDLFAGVGGLSLGFEQEGFKVVLANEFDASIADAYVRNRPDANMVVADIRDLSIERTFRQYRENVQVVIGGPPCQGYSQKGQRRTINDDRNFLFKNYVKVVAEVQPTYFVMENVPNLLTNEGGFFKDEIFALFGELGYVVNAAVLCASDFGVPENRHRAVIIGRRGEGEPVEMPIEVAERVTIWDAISDLNYLESGEGSEVSSYRFGPQTDYQREMREGSDTLYGHVATRHSAVALERMAMIPPKGGKEFLPKRHLTKSIYSGTWERMPADGVSRTITTRFDTPASGQFMHPYLDRAITVREAARIQSFPDTFRFYGTKTSQMKQVGNAVPPKMARAIAKAILKDMQVYGT